MGESFSVLGCMIVSESESVWANVCMRTRVACVRVRTMKLNWRWRRKMIQTLIKT